MNNNKSLLSNESKISPYMVSQLVFLSELINLDPMLGVLSSVLGVDLFGKVVKTFSGYSITFPSNEELKRIVRKVRRLKRHFEGQKLYKSIVGELKETIDIAFTLESKSVRKAVATKITQTMLESFFKSIFDKGESITLDNSMLTSENAVDMYKLKLKELNTRSNMMRALSMLEILRREEKGRDSKKSKPNSTV